MVSSVHTLSHLTGDNSIKFMSYTQKSIPKTNIWLDTNIFLNTHIWLSEMLPADCYFDIIEIKNKLNKI